METKMVRDRTHRAEQVAQAAQGHHERVGSKLAQRCQPLLREGEVMPDWGLVVRLIGRGLLQSSSLLLDADRSHQAELADDLSPREDREEAAESVYDRLTSIRKLAESVFGQAAVLALGYQGATPRLPRDLRDLAEVVKGNLPKLAQQVAEPGLSMDPAPQAAALSADLEALTAALVRYDGETKEAEVTLAAKNSAMAAFDARLSATVRALEGLFELAGEPELSRRVRPSRRAPSKASPQTQPATADDKAPIA